MNYDYKTKRMCAKCYNIFYGGEKDPCNECGNKIGNSPWEFVSAN
jgi:rRNA maturation endonuclease Nob1